jgi:hypothetical protein
MPLHKQSLFSAYEPQVQTCLPGRQVSGPGFQLLWNNADIFKQKLNYIHNNPVEEGLVYYAEDYVYSSAL